MQNSKAKAIKGLSIANIVLAALYIVALLIGTIAIGVVSQYYEPLMDSITNDIPYGYQFGHGNHHGAFSAIDHEFDIDDYGYYLNSDLSDAKYVLPILNLGMGFCIFCILLQAAALAASIIILRNAGRPEKYGMSFGWGIAGAIVSLITGALVQIVLFVVATVFVYQEKQAFQRAQYAVGQAIPHQVIYQNGQAVPAAPTQVAQPNQGAPTSPANQIPGDCPIPSPQAQNIQPSTPIQSPAQTPVDMPGNPESPVDERSAQAIQTADELLDPTTAEEPFEVQEDPGQKERPSE